MRPRREYYHQLVPDLRAEEGARVCRGAWTGASTTPVTRAGIMGLPFEPRPRLWKLKSVAEQAPVLAVSGLSHL